MRWLVGDIQGCAREFEDLLAAINFNPHDDEIWCCGDLVNRGPDSLATLRLFRDIGAKGVIGNHDLYALRVHHHRWARKSSDTLDGLLGAPDAEELIGLLHVLPVLVWLPSDGAGPDCWTVHAGLNPTWGDLPGVADRLNHAPRDAAWYDDPDLRFATTARCCDDTGLLCKAKGPPSDCAPPFVPWDDFYRGDSLVVHGHWAMRGHYRGARSLGLDSSCVHGGALTAWCQDEDRIVQVPARPR